MRAGARGRLFLLGFGLLVLSGLAGALLHAEVLAGALTRADALVLGGILAALAAGWLANVWTRPLREAAATADALLRGLSRRAPILSDDEHGRVAEALNHLARQVETTRDDLQALHERFGSVLGGMREGVIALSIDGRIMLCNRSAEAMLDAPGPLPGQRLLALMRQPALQELLSSRDKNAAREIELTLADGRILAVRMEPLHHADLGAMLVLRDLTALRKLETVRRDFVANASHELRTPVATIQSAAEALQSGGLEEPGAAREFTAVIQRHALRMGRILSDLLDLSRLEAGAWQVRLGPMELAQRLQHTVGLAELAVRERGQTLTLRLDKDLWVRADAGALDQVVSNLLDNASKYTPAGGHITLSAAREGPRVVLRVADDGPGIPLQQRERVFERFYRVDAGRSRQLGGTGLGLSIVRHLVEVMGGRVTVEANHPQGAVFRVDLPASLPGAEPLS